MLMQLFMTNYNFDPIFEYKMNELEATAYKIGLLWLELSRKYFPDYKHTSKFPKKADPRKTSLFKYCYKLARETKGILKFSDYSLYIKAQLQILKHIQLGNTHPLIEPGILVGDKAWIRWKIWKKKYDAMQKRQTLEDVDLDKVPIDKIKKELKNTKEFLSIKFSSYPTEKEMIMLATDMERWIALGKVSPFYALMSPWIKKYCKIKTDLSLFESSINQVFDLVGT